MSSRLDYQTFPRSQGLTATEISPENSNDAPHTSSVERDNMTAIHQSLPLPTGDYSQRGGPLPALNDVRSYATPTTTGSFEQALSPTSSIQFPFTNVFQPMSGGPSYPTQSPQSYGSHTSSFSLERSAPIPPIRSPTHMPSHPHSSTPKSVSPGLSVRQHYATSTPHLSSHMTSRGQDILSNSPPSPHMGSLQHQSMDQSQLITGGGPPLGETQHIHSLVTADGQPVRPEIHARVDKGFFLADRDWTCYRRNYFSVICSYSLIPSTYASPLYLRRQGVGQPEHVLAFGICISAVIDGPGGKVVDLVQHTPKRDKGPQLRPALIKLSPHPSGAIGFGSAPNQGMQHPGHDGSLDGSDFAYPHQTQQQYQAVFDRIQFKSATANNGKRRAAQQYYHLIVELYADVGSPNSGGVAGHPSDPLGGDGGWVKIAFKISAPMVVRGRSPGHYADERRTSSSAGRPGGRDGNSATSNSPTQSHALPEQQSSPVVLSGGGVSNQGQSSNYLSLSTPRSLQNSPSIGSAHPAINPIDPTLTASNGIENDPLDSGADHYQYFPGPLNDMGHTPSSSPFDSRACYISRRSEHQLDPTFYDLSLQSYMGTSRTSASVDSLNGDSYSHASGTSSDDGDPLSRYHNRFETLQRCGKFDATNTSRNYYPSLPAL